MSSDELRVPSQRDDDAGPAHTRSEASHGDRESSDRGAQYHESGGDPVHEASDQPRDDRTDQDTHGERRADSGELARDEGFREDSEAGMRSPRADDEAGMRSPRVDDEYAAAVPGAVSTPEPGYDDETPYRDPYARTGGDMLAEPEPEPEPAPHTMEAPAGHEPADTPGTSATPAHAFPYEGGLFDEDPAEVQARWREVQASFVDDPGEAIQRADGLVGEVVASLTSSLDSRTSALRGRWKDAEAPDTEQLRLALRDYRNVLERLLALSSQSVPGQGATVQGVSGQGVPGQAVPGQGVPGQGVPGHGVPKQGAPGEGLSSRGMR